VIDLTFFKALAEDYPRLIKDALIHLFDSNYTEMNPEGQLLQCMTATSLRYEKRSGGQSVLRATIALLSHRIFF